MTVHEPTAVSVTVPPAMVQSPLARKFTGRPELAGRTDREGRVDEGLVGQRVERDGLRQRLRLVAGVPDPVAIFIRLVGIGYLGAIVITVQDAVCVIVIESQALPSASPSVFSWSGFSG